MDTEQNSGGKKKSFRKPEKKKWFGKKDKRELAKDRGPDQEEKQVTGIRRFFHVFFYCLGIVFRPLFKVLKILFKTLAVACILALIIGGVIGNYTDLWGQPMRLGIGTQAVLTVFGLAVGIFVGCLVMSLAETLKALPAISRRIHLAIGLPYVILAIGLGKMTGSLIYFARRFGG